MAKSSPRPRTLVLASTSPRRIYLLGQVHLKAEVLRPISDERPLPRERPQALVKRLAKEKASSVVGVALQRFGECIIIGADTVVVAPNNRTILGKPRDEKEAEKMLRMLSGKTHTVFTGYCIIHATADKKPKFIQGISPAKVKMRSMSADAVSAYVRSKEPMDKAGSYAAQGLGMALIEKIQGSYTSVIGLPMSEVVAGIEKLGLPLYSWLR